MKVRLDNAVRQYIKARDKNLCTTCGIHKDSTLLGYLDWSHKISRTNLLLRWDERNSIAQCRRCHLDWGNGVTEPLNNAINKLWGEGTTIKLELFSKQNQTIKGTPLDDVEYRLKLEKFYKLKLKAILGSYNTEDIIWDDLVDLNQYEQNKQLEKNKVC